MRIPVEYQRRYQKCAFGCTNHISEKKYLAEGQVLKVIFSDIINKLLLIAATNPVLLLIGSRTSFALWLVGRFAKTVGK